MNITRHEWMLLTACWAEALRAQNQEFTSMDSRTAAEIEAIARQIIPDNDTPGAGRAGVIWFIDRALAGYDQDKARVLHTRAGRDASETGAMFSRIGEHCRPCGGPTSWLAQGD